MKHLVTTLLFGCLITHAFGHALWIETNPTGQKGKPHAVRIVYAEPGETPEKTAGWYSDVKSFELWLISPDQQKTKLTVTPDTDQFTAAFTPDQDGLYTLAIGHTAKDPGGTTKYQFNATAAVMVGQPGKRAVPGANELSVAPVDAGRLYQTGQPVALAGLFKAKPAGKLQITVYSPAGWNRTIQANAGGQADFTPLWPGTYYIEATTTEKESGEMAGKPYHSVWRCATYRLVVSGKK